MSYVLFDDHAKKTEKVIKKVIPKTRKHIRTRISSLEVQIMNYQSEMRNLMFMSRLEWGHHKLNLGKLLVSLYRTVKQSGQDWGEYLTNSPIKIGMGTINKYMLLATIDNVEPYMNYGIDRVYRIIMRDRKNKNRKNPLVKDLKKWMTRHGFPEYDNTDLKNDSSLRTELQKNKKQIDLILGKKAKSCATCCNFNAKGKYCMAIVSTTHQNSVEGMPAYVKAKTGTQARLIIKNPEEFKCPIHNKDITKYIFNH